MAQFCKALALVSLLVGGLFSFASLPDVFQAVERCEKVFDERAESAGPRIVLDPAQKAEVQGLLNLIDPNRVSDKKVKSEINDFKAFILWSLENDPLEFSSPKFANKIRFMARSLNRAVQETAAHANPDFLAHLALIKDVQTRLNHIAQKPNPTYRELAYLADDFTLVIGLAKSWKPGEWLPLPVVVLQHKLGPNYRPEEFLKETRKGIENLLNLAPMLMINHVGSETLSDFVKIFFLPIIKLGITDQLITYDGLSQISEQGFVPSYSDPRTFYTHDLANHGYRSLNKAIYHRTNDFRMILRGDPKIFLTSLRGIVKQFEFYLELETLKQRLTPTEIEALDVILFEIYHELPDEIFGGNPSFTKDALQKAFRTAIIKTIMVEGEGLPLKDYLLDRIVRRLPAENDIGADLPMLKALSANAAKEVLERMLGALGGF